MQEVKRAFGRKGREVIDVHWLLQPYRRRGKAFSSLVSFFSKAIVIPKKINMKNSG